MCHAALHALLTAAVVRPFILGNHLAHHVGYHAEHPQRALVRLSTGIDLPQDKDGRKPDTPICDPRRTPVCDVESYRRLLAGGTEYKNLDIRGDSSPLIAADGAARSHHPVATALHARRASGSRPGLRDDGQRIALAIEGGGMRGCVAAGMAAALNHLELTDAVDVVYGSSAGSLVGAYLLTRQLPLYGGSIYYETLPSAGRAFIDLRNALRSLGLGVMRFTPNGLRDLVCMRACTYRMSLVHMGHCLDYALTMP